MSTALLDPPAKNAAAGKYLTFVLGKEAYGIPVLKVREIIRLPEITAIPRMPEHLRGVINLRGKIVPVVDMRIKFGLPKADATDRTCIIVVQIMVSPTETKLVGLIVDAVEEVHQIPPGEMEPPPNFGPNLHINFIENMAKVKGQVKTLLQIDKVIGQESINLLEKITTETPAQA
jgi:purine-binding chemotaxis protein CheW